MRKYLYQKNFLGNLAWWLKTISWSTIKTDLISISKRFYETRIYVNLGQFLITLVLSHPKEKRVANIYVSLQKRKLLQDIFVLWPPIRNEFLKVGKWVNTYIFFYKFNSYVQLYFQGWGVRVWGESQIWKAVVDVQHLQYTVKQMVLWFLWELVGKLWDIPWHLALDTWKTYFGMVSLAANPCSLLITRTSHSHQAMISAIDALPLRQPIVVQQKQMIYREAVGQGPLSAEVQTVCVTQITDQWKQLIVQSTKKSTEGHRWLGHIICFQPFCFQDPLYSKKLLKNAKNFVYGGYFYLYLPY